MRKGQRRKTAEPGMNDVSSFAEVISRRLTLVFLEALKAILPRAPLLSLLLGIKQLALVLKAILPRVPAHLHNRLLVAKLLRRRHCGDILFA